MSANWQDSTGSGLHMELQPLLGFSVITVSEYDDDMCSIVLYAQQLRELAAECLRIADELEKAD